MIIPLGSGMYKVMIVDDEPSIRTGLPKSLTGRPMFFHLSSRA